MDKRRNEEEDANTLGWMVTFSDLITLMFTFFVLLLSLCSLEAGKIKQFSSACSEAIGVLSMKDSCRKWSLGPLCRQRSG